MERNRKNWPLKVKHRCCWNQSKQRPVTDGASTSLVSYNTTKEIELIEIPISAVTPQLAKSSKDQIFRDYPDLFTGINTRKTHLVKLHRWQCATSGSISKTNFLSLVSEGGSWKIDDLEADDIIVKVGVSLERVFSKLHWNCNQAEKFQLRADMHVPNTTIEREYYVTPTTDDTTTALNGSSLLNSRLELWLPPVRSLPQVMLYHNFLINSCRFQAVQETYLYDIIRSRIISRRHPPSDK